MKNVKKFIRAHGDSAYVVIQPVGRLGVRLSLVGDDGVLGDQFVDTLEQAHAVLDAVPALEEDDWSKKTTLKIDVPAGHWKKMAGSSKLV